MKHIKTKIIGILLFITVVSCNQSKNSKVTSENEPEVFKLEETDPEMNEAIAKANESFHLFETAIQNDGDKKNYYSIKQKFVTPDHSYEHIWVGQIAENNSEYTGIVGNKPLTTTEVKFSDVVKIDKNIISDWMIIDQTTRKVTGGYTVKLLRARMSEEERNQFDANNRLIFD